MLVTIVNPVLFSLAYRSQVYLALEAKEANVHSKGAEMVKQFRQSFYDMTCTIHPYGIPGEAQGKSSNESWAAKQASKHYSHDVVKKDVIITVMDGVSLSMC